jgi:hypothetical protein
LMLCRLFDETLLVTWVDDDSWIASEVGRLILSVLGDQYPNTARHAIELCCKTWINMCPDRLVQRAANEQRVRDQEAEQLIRDQEV